MNMKKDFLNELKIKLEDKSITTPSQWAEKRRIMGLPFEGPYSFKYHPWCRELHDSKASWNVSMKSSQAGFTEVGINLAIYTIDVLKRNVLYVLPTWGDACDFSRSRFNPAIRMSPHLKSVVRDVNNVGLKMAGDVALYIRGSRGDANLKSIPVSILILDELDEMDQSQIELALQRLRGQPEKKVWYISTPTTPGHGVALEYAKSTQEHFRFKCPGCNKIDEFHFPESLELCGEDVNDPDCRKSFYKCTMCGYRFHHERIEGKITQDEKLMTLTNTGFWEPTIKGTDPDRRGFKINQLYSYTVGPDEIAIDYFKSLSNNYAKQEFHKSILGEPFVGQQSQVTEEMILQAIKPYSCKQFSIKSGAQKRMITMGIDRGNWCNYVVCEWFYPQFCIDLNNSAQCRILDAGAILGEDFCLYAGRLMEEWEVRACMVDMDPDTQEARRFARKFPKYVWLNRYREGRVGKEMSITDDGTYAPIATVDRTNWLDISLGRFFAKTIELPNDLPRGFTEQIKNLVRVYEEDAQGNPVARYKNYEKPDHYGHALNYAEMALPCAASLATNQNIGKFL